MVFGGQEVQVLMVLIVQIACLYLVWMWRESVVKKKRVSTACLGKFLYLRGIDIAEHFFSKLLKINFVSLCSNGLGFNNVA